MYLQKLKENNFQNFIHTCLQQRVKVPDGIHPVENKQNAICQSDCLLLAAT